MDTDRARPVGIQSGVKDLVKSGVHIGIYSLYGLGFSEYFWYRNHISLLNMLYRSCRVIPIINIAQPT